VLFDLVRTLGDSPNSTSKTEFYAAVLEQLADSPYVAGLDPQELGRLSDEIKATESPDSFCMVHRILFSILRHSHKSAEELPQAELEALNNKVKEVLASPEVYNIQGYKVWPDAKPTLDKFRSHGFKLGLLVNTSRPGKVHKILKEFGLDEFFDYIGTSAELKSALPSTSIIDKVVSLLNPSDLWIVSDKLDRHIKAAQQSGHKAVWINLKPKHMARIIEAIDTRAVSYPSAVISLNQLPSLIAYHEVPDRIKVGYIYNKPHKKRNLAKKHFFIDNERISFQCLEPAANFDVQGDYDIIMHKAQYLMQENSPEISRRYLEYLNSRPTTVVLDPFDVVEYSKNRNTFLGGLISVVGLGRDVHGFRVRAPWGYHIQVVTEETVSLLEEAMQLAGVQFPVMIKTELQSTIAQAHTMRICFNMEGIRTAGAMYPTAVLVQEFVNHNATVYKAYTIGEFTAIFPRRSCGNLKSPGIDYIDFKTSEPWPEVLKSQEEPVVLELDSNMVKEISKIVSDFTGATLFGYDILVQDGTNDMVIVDFNSMPGFTEISDVSEPLWRLIEQKARRLSLAPY